jgi:uncharacterized protein YjiS (DUF1127 family)
LIAPVTAGLYRRCFQLFEAPTMFKSLSRYVEKTNKRNTLYRELTSLSDRDLADIGIVRADIADIFRNAR